MKKYASLLLLALLLNGCDDGDLTVDSVDFENITPQTCDQTTNTLIYKLKPQEALLLQLPPGSIINDPTLKDAPVIYNIDNNGNGSYRYLYRAYDGAVATANICNIIPPKTPNVTQEWLAIGGVIEIATKQVEETDLTTGSSKVTGYVHSINLKNVTYLKPGDIKQVMPEIAFGDLKTTVTPVVVNFIDEDANYCDTNKKIYNDNGVSSLTIENLDPSLIKNETTPVGTQRTSLINLNNTMNKVYYRAYAGTLPPKTSEDYFCLEKTPSTPPVSDSWYGKDGEANVSGIIQVTTTVDVSGKVFRHRVVLVNAVLRKGNSSFKLGNSFLLGTAITTL